MLIGEYVQQFEVGINDASNTANSALVQSREALDQAKNATAIANEALGQSRASVIELINSVNASTVTLIGNKNDGSQTTTNLPVASELQAGVMNTATYVSLKDLNSRVTSLESNTTTYIVVLPNATPTQAEILNAYRTAYPLAPNPPLDGTTVIDVDKQLFYRYVKNGDIWIKTSGFKVAPFTNENAGIIKGSTTPGQVQAETDGTGSLVGYDTLVSNIEQNTTAIGTANGRIDAVETKNTQQDTAINNAQTSANNAFAGASISKNANNQILNLSRGAGVGVNLPIDPVDTQHAGLVTPTMYNQWNAGGLKPLPITFVTLNTTDKTAQDLSQNPNFTVRLIVENNELRLYVKNDSPVTRTMRVYLFGMKGLNSINCTTGLGGVRNLDQGREATMDLSTSGMANYYEISWGNETHILYTYKIWQTNNALTWPIYYCEQAFE